MRGLAAFALLVCGAALAQAPQTSLPISASAPVQDTQFASPSQVYQQTLAPLV